MWLECNGLSDLTQNYNYLKSIFMAQCIRIISITFYIRSISITRPLPHSFIQSLNDKLPSSFYVFGSYRGPSEHLVGISVLHNTLFKKNI